MPPLMWTPKVGWEKKRKKGRQRQQRVPRGVFPKRVQPAPSQNPKTRRRTSGDQAGREETMDLPIKKVPKYSEIRAERKREEEEEEEDCLLRPEPAES
jgi:hypothetical protein